MMARMRLLRSCILLHYPRMKGATPSAVSEPLAFARRTGQKAGVFAPHSTPEGGMQPAGRPAWGQSVSNSGVLIVREDTAIKGEIRNCRQLEVYGYVEGDIAAGNVLVHQGGRCY